ncbi:MAG: hypothetical protein DRP57_04315 [Spirochaetes bacterium]|nr:MAG: hypothetical protein DRP57_04315 [Spirochaetota bacterium]
MMKAVVSTTEDRSIDWLEEHRYVPKDDEEYCRKEYIVEVASLEELLLIADKTECQLIISRDSQHEGVAMDIEVYDGHRE